MFAGLPWESWTTAEVISAGWTLSLIAALLTLPSVLLRRAGRPLSALSWMLALLSMPPIGLLAWWFIGRSHLEWTRRRHRRTIARLDASLQQLRDDAIAQQQASRALFGAVRLPDELKPWVFPPSAGNTLRLLDTAHEAFPAWADAIASAEHHVHAVFYIWRDDKIGRRLRDLLVERARAGVEVRLVLDHLGCISLSLKRGFFRELREAGGRVEWFMPIRPPLPSPLIHFRNHRKLLVVDGCVGYLGGINVGDEYLDWLDLAVELRGPCLDQLQEIFADDWAFCTGPRLGRRADESMDWTPYFGRWRHALPKDDAHAEDASNATLCAAIASDPTQRFNATHELLFLAIGRCTTRLWIMTPYLVPGPALVAALQSASYRGVDVRVMVPARSDVPLVRRASRSFYPALLRAGVRVFEYQGAMLHAKALVFDADRTLIGSANLDSRSFRLNFESSCLAQDPTLNARLADVFCRNLQQSQEIRNQDIERLAPWTRLVDAAAHLLSPLL